jgi:hypothetical protein
MKFIIKTFLSLILVICLLCIGSIYRSNMFGFLIVPAFVFMSILIMIVADNGD